MSWFWNANGKTVAMKIQLFISADDNFFEPNFMNIIYRYETSFHRPRRSLLRLAVSRHSRVKREYEEGWVGSASVYRKKTKIP